MSDVTDTINDSTRNRVRNRRTPVYHERGPDTRLRNCCVWRDWILPTTTWVKSKPGDPGHPKRFNDDEIVEVKMGARFVSIRQRGPVA